MRSCYLGVVVVVAPSLYLGFDVVVGSSVLLWVGFDLFVAVCLFVAGSVCCLTLEALQFSWLLVWSWLYFLLSLVYPKFVWFLGTCVS